MGSWLSDVYTHWRASGTKTEDEKKDATEARQLQNSQIVKQLVDLAKPERHLLAGALGALVLSSSTNLIFPYAIGQVIDNVMPPERYIAAAGEAAATLETAAEAIPVEAVGILDPYMFSALGGLFFVAAGWYHLSSTHRYTRTHRYHHPCQHH
jgi:ABC-type multidrug transport system fused ATPase/permease subunit